MFNDGQPLRQATGHTNHNNRVESKDLDTKVTCRKCWEEIKAGVAAYHCQRCVSCGFFIHDVCFRPPPANDREPLGARRASEPHPLTLSTTGHLQNQQGLSSDDDHVCTICAGSLDPRAFAYVCSRRTGDGHDCHEFSAHPSWCVDLSRKHMASDRSCTSMSSRCCRSRPTAMTSGVEALASTLNSGAEASE